MVQDSPSRKMDQFIVRLPDGMRDRIKAAADSNNRSMNAEVVATLEKEYPAPYSVEEDLAMAAASSKFFESLRGDPEFSQIGFRLFQFILSELEVEDPHVEVEKLDRAGFFNEVSVLQMQEWMKRRLNPWVEANLDSLNSLESALSESIASLSTPR